MWRATLHCKKLRRSASEFSAITIFKNTIASLPENDKACLDSQRAIHPKLTHLIASQTGFTGVVYQHCLLLGFGM